MGRSHALDTRTSIGSATLFRARRTGGAANAFSDTLPRLSAARDRIQCTDFDPQPSNDAARDSRERIQPSGPPTGHPSVTHFDGGELLQLHGPAGGLWDDALPGGKFWYLEVPAGTFVAGQSDRVCPGVAGFRTHRGSLGTAPRDFRGYSALERRHDGLGVVDLLPHVAVFRAVVGLGEGAYGPSANALLCAGASPEKRGRAIGIYNTGMALGGAAGIFWAPCWRPRLGGATCFGSRGRHP